MDFVQQHSHSITPQSVEGLSCCHLLMKLTSLLPFFQHILFPFSLVLPPLFPRKSKLILSQYGRLVFTEGFASIYSILTSVRNIPSIGIVVSAFYGSEYLDSSHPLPFPPHFYVHFNQKLLSDKLPVFDMPLS